MTSASVDAETSDRGAAAQSASPSGTQHFGRAGIPVDPSEKPRNDLPPWDPNREKTGRTRAT
jgi:hypothetical protein